MNQDLVVLIAALIVNLLAVTALSFAVSSLALSWLFFSVLSAATAVAIYSGWRVLDRALRLTKPTPTRPASTSETGFQCSISDTTGLLVTYVGPDSCELSRLLLAIREIRRSADPAA